MANTEAANIQLTCYPPHFDKPLCVANNEWRLRNHEKVRQNLSNFVQINYWVHTVWVSIKWNSQYFCTDGLWIEKKCLSELIRTLLPTQLPLNRQCRSWSPFNWVSSIITVDRALLSPLLWAPWWKQASERNQTASIEVPPSLIKNHCTGGNLFIFSHKTHYRNLTEDSFAYINIMHLHIAEINMLNP